MTSNDASPIRVDVQASHSPDGRKLALSCSDRTSVVPLGQLLSTLRSLTNTVVDAAVERERSAGREISCKAGCGACCRQLVPLSVTEARQLPHLIAGLDEAHRERVLARFGEATSKLRANGMFDRLEKFSALSREERSDLSTEYFRLGIPCPFLEEESCSIHPVRPVICRQYLVTSAPIHCSNPSPESVAAVAIGANVFAALQRMEAHEPKPPRSVPMIAAPILKSEQSDSEDDSRKTVPAWMNLLLAQIGKARVSVEVSRAKTCSSDNLPNQGDIA